MYNPSSSDSQRIANLKNVPDSVISAFKHLRTSHQQAQEKYLVLIFLKLYKSHLECCNQSYDLRNKFSNSIDTLTDPLLYEYILSTKQKDLSKHIEFISSGIAHTWVEQNKGLLSYDKIAIEFQRIEKEHIRISKGVF